MAAHPFLNHVNQRSITLLRDHASYLLEVIAGTRKSESIDKAIQERKGRNDTDRVLYGLIEPTG